MNELVSIIIPAYKAANYLAEAIDSALAQSYPNIEIIVVNDGSPDNGATRDVAMQYRDRIRYFEKENGGCASALNYGIQIMNGEWFSWLSHDDLYYSNKISVLISLLQKYNREQEKIILGCNYNILNAHGVIKSNIFDNSTGLMTPEKAFGETLNVSTFNGCGLLIPKRAFLECGIFRTDYRHLLDREMWMRFAYHGYTYLFSSEPLVINRTHGEQVTVKAKDALYSEEEQLIDEYTELLNESRKVSFLRELMYFAYKRKHYSKGKRIKELLKEKNDFDFHTEALVAKYTIEGKAKSLIRDAYKSILRHR